MHIAEGDLPLTHEVGWSVASGIVLAYAGWSLRERLGDKFLRTSGQNLTPQPPSLRRKGEPEGGLTPLCLTVERFCPMLLREALRCGPVQPRVDRGYPRASWPPPQEDTHNTSNQ